MEGKNLFILCCLIEISSWVFCFSLHMPILISYEYIILSLFSRNIFSFEIYSSISWFIFYFFLKIDYLYINPHLIRGVFSSNNIALLESLITFLSFFFLEKEREKCGISWWINLFLVVDKLLSKKVI